MASIAGPGRRSELALSKPAPSWLLCSTVAPPLFYLLWSLPDEHLAAFTRHTIGMVRNNEPTSLGTRKKTKTPAKRLPEQSNKLCSDGGPKDDDRKIRPYSYPTCTTVTNQRPRPLVARQGIGTAFAQPCFFNKWRKRVNHNSLIYASPIQLSDQLLLLSHAIWRHAWVNDTSYSGSISTVQHIFQQDTIEHPRTLRIEKRLPLV